MSTEKAVSPDAGRSNNYDAVDAFKFIAAVMVVAIHTSPFIEYGYWNYYVTCFCRMEEFSAAASGLWPRIS